MIVVVSCHHPTDDERIYHKQIKTLLKKKFQISYFTRSEYKNLSNNLIYHNNSDIDVDIDSFINKVWDTIKNEQRITHVQIHETDLLPLFKRIKSNNKKIKTIYDVHELREPLYRTFSNRSNIIKQLSIYIRNKKESKYLKYVDNIILANPLHSENPYNKFGIPTTIIENFVEKKHIVDSRNEFSKPSLIYHGHLGAYRGISDLVKAMQIILENIPEAMLTLVGGFRRSEFGIKTIKYIEENKMTNSIKIIDQIPHSEIWGILKNHRIGVIPFRKNPFSMNCTPTKLFEMMASGLEIVATDLPPIKYFVKDTVYWAEPDNITSLANAIQKVIQAKNKLPYAKKNLSLVRKKYNWENIESRYLDLFE
mgnify:FL=1